MENALERLSTNQNATIDSFGQQENDEINDTLNENLHNEEFLDDELTCNFPESGFSCSTHLVFQDSLINENIWSFKGGDPEKPRMLILAPTGVAAINIDGTTIHTALGINVGYKLYPLNDSQRGIL